MRAAISIYVAESYQEFSSSISEKDLESSESMEEDVVSITNQASPYQGDLWQVPTVMAKGAKITRKAMKTGSLQLR